MSTKKYEIVKSNSIFYSRKKLYRIRALKDFVNVLGIQIRKGDIGGYVENEDNLSQEGDCWIFDEAKVYDSAKVSEDAVIYDYSEVFGNAKIYGKAAVFNKAKVYGNAEIYDYATVSGSSEIYGDSLTCGTAEVYNSAKVFDKAVIYGNAKIFGKALVFGKAQVCGDARIFGKAKIFNLEIKSGNYLFGSLDEVQTLELIQKDYNELSFRKKYLTLDFLVSEEYLKTFISKFDKYSALADALNDNSLWNWDAEEICDLLSQMKKDVEKIKLSHSDIFNEV